MTNQFVEFWLTYKKVFGSIENVAFNSLQVECDTSTTIHQLYKDIKIGDRSRQDMISTKLFSIGFESLF